MALPVAETSQYLHQACRCTLRGCTAERRLLLSGHLVLEID